MSNGGTSRWMDMETSICWTVVRGKSGLGEPGLLTAVVVINQAFKDEKSQGQGTGVISSHGERIMRMRPAKSLCSTGKTKIQSFSRYMLQFIGWRVVGCNRDAVEKRPGPPP